MRSKKGNGRIYLAGGGDEERSFSLDETFLNTLPTSGRFLYVPIALRGHDLYPKAPTWMKGILELHGREDIAFEVVDDPAQYTLEDLQAYEGVYIGGGNTWSLLKELNDAGFSRDLVQYWKEGGQIYGGSAGAIMLGKRIDTHDDPNTVDLDDVSGLDLLNGFSVTCHFKEEDGDRFKTWATQNGLPIICLPEETGLIVEDQTAVCIGTKPCVVCFSDGTHKQIEPDGSMDLQ